MKYICPICAHSLDLPMGRKIICGKCRLALVEEKPPHLSSLFPEFEFSQDWNGRDAPTLEIYIWAKSEVERVFNLFMEHEVMLHEAGLYRVIIKGPNKFKMELRLTPSRNPWESNLVKHKRNMLEAIVKKRGPGKTRYDAIPKKRGWESILKANPDLIMLEG